MMINFAVQKALADKINDDKYFKNTSKHETCSKCSTELTKENYKKDRTFCRNCFNTVTLDMMRKRLENGSSKQSSSSKQPSKEEVNTDKILTLKTIYNINYDYAIRDEVKEQSKRALLLLSEVYDDSVMDDKVNKQKRGFSSVKNLLDSDRSNIFEKQ